MILPNDVARCTGIQDAYPYEICPLREQCMRFRSYESDVIRNGGEERIISIFHPSRIGKDCNLIMGVRDEENGM